MHTYIHTYIYTHAHAYTYVYQFRKRRQKELWDKLTSFLSVVNSGDVAEKLPMFFYDNPKKAEDTLARQGMFMHMYNARIYAYIH